MTNNTQTLGKGWNIGLWIAQVTLAIFYAMGAAMKLTMAPESLIEMGLLWVDGAPIWGVRMIGTIELAGVIGIILPAALRIKPKLTPLAALGLLAIQFLAIPLHLSRGEFSALPFNLICVLLAVFVVWGRSRKSVITPRLQGQ